MSVGLIEPPDKGYCDAFWIVIALAYLAHNWRITGERSWDLSLETLDRRISLRRDWDDP